MRRGDLIEPMMPWGGLTLAALGWFAAHQVGSESAFANCDSASPLLMLLINLAGLGFALLGGLYSYRLYRRGAAETEGRRFLGAAGMLVAALLSFALVMQALGGLIVPRCLA